MVDEYESEHEHGHKINYSNISNNDNNIYKYYNFENVSHDDTCGSDGEYHGLTVWDACKTHTLNTYIHTYTHTHIYIYIYI